MAIKTETAKGGQTGQNAVSGQAQNQGQDQQQRLQELSDAFRNDIANQGGNNATQRVEQFISDVQALFQQGNQQAQN
jgi:hypothetical protein